jgi:hypothetical protein
MQLDENSKNLSPISYASRTLNTSEKSYSTTDKEGLAIVWPVKHFHSYLYSSKFLIITDHDALTVLLDKFNLEGRLARWSYKL